MRGLWGSWGLWGHEGVSWFLGLIGFRIEGLGFGVLGFLSLWILVALVNKLVEGSDEDFGRKAP